MASLVGIPHKEGLEILKNELFERIRKFELLNDKNSLIMQEICIVRFLIAMVY